MCLRRGMHCVFLLQCRGSGLMLTNGRVVEEPSVNPSVGCPGFGFDRWHLYETREIIIGCSHSKCKANVYIIWPRRHYHQFTSVLYSPTWAPPFLAAVGMGELGDLYNLGHSRDVQEQPV